ncbi:MAG: neutral/alkaline non-lysosomal ceramidase N-terminal domain-containing protein [Phycisphaerae bacterium]|nr:neutral/alkaline non-lysosomal ceramidase N-terminal domain-containing protein [Phycisphaerae bacterium]
MAQSTHDKPPDQTQPSVAAEIGVARRDVTPPIGIYARQWGAAKHDAAEGVHRPLIANVMVLRESSDDAPLVLATLDGGWFQDLDDETRVRQALIDALDLDEARVLIALSHTHAACSLCTADKDLPGGHLVEPYLGKITDALIDATREAIATAVTGTLEWGTGQCRLAANRDLKDPDADRYACGFNPSEDSDETVLVGRATDEDGRILGTIVNYACHATTLAWDNRLISPDYVGAMRELVEQHTGGAPCLFLQGASGNLGPREGFTGDVTVADANGRWLGYCVIAALESMLPPRTTLTYTGVVESGAPLATWGRRPCSPSTVLDARRIEIALPLKPMPSLKDVEKQLAECDDRVTAERLRRRLRKMRHIGSGPTVTIPTWFWRLGQAVLVAHPNEIYSMFQQELRSVYPEIAVPVVTVVNGGLGYITAPECHDTDIYQVWSSPFARNAMDVLVGESIGMVAELLAD